MLDDILKSSKDYITDRLSSPLLGSFAVAWCLWNYRFLVILFSDNSVSQTFRLIDDVAFPTMATFIFRGIVLPLSTALIYIFVYPYPARVVYEFTQRRQRETNLLRQRIDEETPLTVEESRRIRSEYLERERRHQQLVDRLTAEVSSLTIALEEARKSLPPPPMEAPMHETVEPGQLALLKALSNHGDGSTERQLFSGLTTPKLRLEYDLGELVRRKLITRTYNPYADEATYKFTHEGRKVFLDGTTQGA